MTNAEIEDINIATLSEDSSSGYVFEVDLDYPDDLHDAHSDYPLAPETKEVSTEELSPFTRELAKELSLAKQASNKKLVPNLNNKQKYVVHYMNLQQYLHYGLQLRKIHRVLTFQQSRWLKPYIDLNTEKRKNAKNAFEKNLFKLMNNRYVINKCNIVNCYY